MKMKKLLVSIGFLLFAVNIFAADFDDTDQLYLWDTSLSAQYFETWADFVIELETNFYSKTAEDTWRSSVTQVEMGYLHGVESDIQTQFSAHVLETAINTLEKLETVSNGGAYMNEMLNVASAQALLNLLFLPANY